MVNVQIGRGCPASTIVGRSPLARSCLACAVDGDGAGIPLEDVLAGVARSRDGDPRREQVTVVVVAAHGRLDRERSQLGLGGGGGGNAGLWETC